MIHRIRPVRSLVRVLVVCGVGLLLVVLLASCVGTASGQEGWESWDQIPLSLRGDGVVVSVPPGFGLNTILGTTVYMMASLDDPDPPNHSIVVINVSPCDPCGLPREPLDMDRVGQRDYPAYVWVEEREGTNPSGRALYLAGGRWWLVTTQAGSEWSDENRRLFDEFLKSLDHG